MLLVLSEKGTSCTFDILRSVSIANSPARLETWQLEKLPCDIRHNLHQMGCARAILFVGKEIKVTGCSGADPSSSQTAISPPTEVDAQKEPPRCSQLRRAGGDDSFGNWNLEANPLKKKEGNGLVCRILLTLPCRLSPWVAAEGIPIMGLWHSLHNVRSVLDEKVIA